MVVIWWIVAFLPSVGYYYRNVYVGYLVHEGDVVEIFRDG